MEELRLLLEKDADALSAEGRDRVLKYGGGMSREAKRNSNPDQTHGE